MNQNKLYFQILVSDQQVVKIVSPYDNFLKYILEYSFLCL